MDYYFTFINKEEITPGIYQFHFKPETKIDYIAGMYIEFHLPHPNMDSRGEKRHFTLVSSPTEPGIKIATRINSDSSSFKQTLLNLPAGSVVRANELEGEFTLPQDSAQKILFIAGGIGITPYRSMAKYLLDTGQKRDIVLMYAAQKASDIVFKLELEAAQKIGLKTLYYLGDNYITPEIIKKDVPDFWERKIYVSGPEKMVEAFETMLLSMGVKDKNLKRDFFDNYTETYQQ